MLLSILIPTIDERRDSFKRLVLMLTEQIIDEGVEETTEIISLCDRGLLSIGAKRNELLSRAKGEYVCFIDDDDIVDSNYIGSLMAGILDGVDCCSLRGVYSIDGVFDGIFEHSIKYTEWKTNPPTEGIKYERNPNHLNCIKSGIAKQFKFPETWHGEDHDWSKQLQRSGLIKTEHYITDIMYHYQHKRK